MNLATYKTLPTEKRPEQPKLLDVPTGMIVYSRGRAGLMRDAAAAQALVRIGRNVRINTVKLDAYYDAIAGE